MDADSLFSMRPIEPVGQSARLCLKLWPRLRHYVLDGRYRIDNNAVERSQRRSVMGRKNYLSNKNNRAAEDNAVFYSLLESCHIVGMNAREWLIHALTNLHNDSTEEDIQILLPYNYNKSRHRPEDRAWHFYLDKNTDYFG